MFLKGTADQIADQVRSEIESGALAPGSQLSQVQLAERFGLSRIPIREALRQLQSEGYVIYRPNRGATVSTEPSGEGLAEIVRDSRVFGTAHYAACRAALRARARSACV